MRVLILDDVEIRHQRFAKILSSSQLFHAYTFRAAQKIIDDQAALNLPIEMACLDHDLGDHQEADFEVGMYGNHYFNGADFAFWLSKHPACPLRILIHSHNSSGVERMRRHLLKVDGLDLLISPFKA